MLDTTLKPSSAATRGILFDFDGTIGQTLPAWTDAFGAALREHGVHASTEQVIDYCFHSNTDEVIRAHGIQDATRFKEQVWENVLVRLDTVSHFPLIHETLDALRDNGFRIAIVTNSRRPAVEPALSRWKILHHFEAFVTIDDVSHGKPDPEMIHRAINQLNLSPSHTYIIGDSKADVIAGQRAGIKTIGFSPAENHKYLALEALRLTEPSHVLHSYTDLWAVLGLKAQTDSARLTK